MAKSKFEYSEAQISKLLRGIYRGTINANNLPLDLYQATYKHLLSGVYDGFGFDPTTAKGTKLIKLLDLRDNVYLFSGAKTYQQTREMVTTLKDPEGNYKPFKAFRDDVMQVYDKYNENWLKAEYETAIGQSRMSEQWDYIQSTKDVLPFLTFSTNGHACPECAPFNNLTRRVDDKIWSIATPLLHFNCQCILEQSDDRELSSDSFVKSLQPNIDKIDPMFAQNVGKTGEIFTKDSPYIKEAPVELGRKNFGLPIPKD